MKNIINFIIPVIILLLPPSVSFGEFSLPDHVYTIDELSDAIEEANKYEQPISFAYSDQNTDCGLATSATLDAFNELVKTTIMVYASSNKEDSDRGKIPSIVKGAIKSPKAGRYIPKTIIVDAKMSKIIAIVPYVRDRYERLNLLKAVNEEIEENTEQTDF